MNKEINLNNNTLYRNIYSKMKQNKYSTLNYWINIYKKSVNNHNVEKRIYPIVKKVSEICKINKNTTILEIGCGHGNYTYQFLKLTKKIIGLDHCTYAINNPCKEVIITDANKLPFKDKSFDLVLIMDTLHHIEDIEPVIKEIKRVSKEYIVIYEMNPKNIFTKIMALTRKEERLTTKRPLYMKYLQKYFKGYSTVYKTFVFHLLFTNVFPDFLMQLLPKPRLIDNNILGVEYLIILKLMMEDV